MITRVGIALGSNLGDSMARLREAIELLRGIAAPGEELLSAPVYRTAPVACPPDSPDFYNTVVEISYQGTARDLLTKTREIEERLGRVRGPNRNAPRSIDLDILYCGNEIISEPDLELPHPRIAARRFVLQPLAAIRPELVLPGHRLTVAELLLRLPDDGTCFMAR
jgi:2-amino-4-hydroxy-6-hydroxymethyldihydropteridine diphosphokinase